MPVPYARYLMGTPSADSTEGSELGGFVDISFLVQVRSVDNPRHPLVYRKPVEGTKDVGTPDVPIENGKGRQRPMPAVGEEGLIATVITSAGPDPTPWPVHGDLDLTELSILFRIAGDIGNTV